MNEHTELEEKLFEYIRFLIGLNNIYERAFAYLYKGQYNTAEWVNDNWDKIEKVSKFDAMLEQLNTEFGWDAKKVTLEELENAGNRTDS